MDRLTYIELRMRWIQKRKLVQRDWQEELVLKMEMIDLLNERKVLLNIK